MSSYDKNDSPVFHYSMDVLLALRNSPLVKIPEGLPSSDFFKPSIEHQERRFTKNAYSKASTGTPRKQDGHFHHEAKTMNDASHRKNAVPPRYKKEPDSHRKQGYFRSEQPEWMEFSEEEATANSSKDLEEWKHMMKERQERNTEESTLSKVDENNSLLMEQVTPGLQSQSHQVSDTVDSFFEPVRGPTTKAYSSSAPKETSSFYSGSLGSPPQGDAPKFFKFFSPAQEIQPHFPSTAPPPAPPQIHPHSYSDSRNEDAIGFQNALECLNQQFMQCQFQNQSMNLAPSPPVKNPYPYAHAHSYSHSQPQIQPQQQPQQAVSTHMAMNEYGRSQQNHRSPLLNQSQLKRPSPALAFGGNVPTSVFRAVARGPPRQNKAHSPLPQNGHSDNPQSPKEYNVNPLIVQRGFTNSPPF